MKRGFTDANQICFPTREVETLNLDEIAEGDKARLRVNLVDNGLGRPVLIPVIVIRGRRPGPVLGLTAALHGNELNGLPIICELCRKINPKKLAGTIVAVPVVNIPGFLNNTRYFRDGRDLNRLFPGKADGITSERYVFHFMEKVVHPMEYLVDLHTTSFGRQNSLYVRADLTHPQTYDMAYLQRPQIMVHKRGTDGTFRGEVAERGISAICLEVGSPLRFQRRFISRSLTGLKNIMAHLGMIRGKEKKPTSEPLICKNSYWLRTNRGGILEVYPKLVDHVEKGDLVAVQRNLYGDVTEEYRAPEDGVVVGKYTNPVVEEGSPILHLGILGDPRG